MDYFAKAKKINRFWQGSEYAFPLVILFMCNSFNPFLKFSREVIFQDICRLLMKEFKLTVTYSLIIMIFGQSLKKEHQLSESSSTTDTYLGRIKISTIKPFCKNS